MKITPVLLSVLLAASMLFLSIKISLNTQDGSELLTDELRQEIVLNNIMTRNSVRKYTQEKVSAEDIEILLKAGMAAPTGGNKRPWEFIVVDDPALIQQMPSVTKGAHMAKNAPLVIIVCGDPSQGMAGIQSEYWIQDTSAATENLLLAAHGIGLGAVWCGVWPVLEKVETLRNILSIPENMIPLNIIVIGHPDGEQVVKDKWNPAKVHYNQF